MTAAIYKLPERISFKAYSTNHQVELHDGGNRHHARLIDISSAGARIALNRNGGSYRLNQELGVNIRLADKGVESGAIPGRVNWVQDGEIEVAFASPLGMSARDLQAAVG